VFAYFGSFSVVILAGYLLEVADNDRQGFLYLAMVSGLLASLVLWACFAICKEPAEDPSQQSAPLTLKATYHSMRQNTAFIVAFAAILTMVTGATVISKTALYVFEYEMGDRAAGNTALIYFTLFGFIAIPFLTWMTLKTSKRFVWMAGSAITTFGLLALWFNPAHSVEHMQLNYLLISLGVGAYGVTFWGMVPDTVEYGEWRTGVRVESMIFGSITFAQKAAVAMSAVLLGLLLDAIGYQAGAVQSAETLTGLRAIVVFVPLTGVLVSVVVMCFYPLSPKRHAEIVAEIEARAAD
jgi:GPH family glycoside/pentoside/hexuronide:cation symporter